MDDNKKSDLTEAAKEKTAKAARSEHKRVKSDKKRSFNVVDVILFLMILTFLSVVIFLFASNTDIEWGSGETAKVEYTVEISGISQEMAAKIRVGDQVLDAENNYVIGSVTNTEIEDCVEYVYNEASGRIEAVAYTDEGSSSSVRKNLLITITADARYTKGGGYTVNGYRVAVNQEMKLCFPGYTGEGQCISLIILETEVN